MEKRESKAQETTVTLPEPWYQTPDGSCRLWLGDCTQLLPLFPEASVDLVFADPPYFLSDGGVTCKSGKMACVNKGPWDIPRSARENYEFHFRWLAECRRVLQPNGTIWVSGTYHSIFSIGCAMQELGYRILSDVIWVKPNPPPNLSCRYFTHSTEILIWAARSEKSKHVFQYETVKAIAGGKQMRNVWEIAPPGTSERRFGSHPTQKPLALLERIVASTSREGDVVLDPFAGSGTTGLACLKLGRRFLGIELNDEYVSIAVRRFEDWLNQLRLL